MAKCKKICPHCKETFEGYNSKIYCSRLCRERAVRAAKKKEIYENECKYCHEPILTTDKRKSFCNEFCRNSYHNENLTEKQKKEYQKRAKEKWRKANPLPKKKKSSIPEKYLKRGKISNSTGRNCMSSNCI